MNATDPAQASVAYCGQIPGVSCGFVLALVCLALSEVLGLLQNSPYRGILHAVIDMSLRVLRVMAGADPTTQAIVSLAQDTEASSYGAVSTAPKSKGVATR